MSIKNKRFTLFLVCCVVAVNAYIYAKETQELKYRASTVNGGSTANYAGETLEQERWRDLVWPANDCRHSGCKHCGCPYKANDSSKVIVFRSFGECDNVCGDKT